MAISLQQYKELRAEGRTPQEIKKAEERGVLGELLPTAFQIGGGILGGIAGAPAAGVGAVPGAITGAVVGGVAGESIQQAIEKRFGQREQLVPSQVAASGITGGVLEATGIGIAKGVGKVASLVRKPVINFISKLSGFASTAVERAFQRTPGVIRGAQEGEPALVEIVRTTAQKFNRLAKESVKKSQQELDNIVKNTSLPKHLKIQAKKFKGIITQVIRKGGDFVDSMGTKLRKQHNIGMLKDNTLVFDRPNQPSRIVSGSEQKAIQDAWGLLNSIKTNLSLRHFNAVLEKLIVLKSKTPTGTPTGPESKLVIKQMMDEIMDFARKIYPKEYVEFLAKNLKQRTFIESGKEIFGSTEHLTPKELSIIEKRLLRLYNTGELGTREFVEEAGEKIGEDIAGTAAGTLIETGGQVSARAPTLTSRGLVEQAIQFIPRELVRNYVKTGTISGLSTHPIVNFLVKATGLTARAIIQEIANVAQVKKTR